MNILIFNWRDIKHPLSGGAEISTQEHAKGWVKAGHNVTIFASAFAGGALRETIDGVTIIRRGSHYTVHVHAFLYYMRFARLTTDLVVDEFHFIPFFTPLYVKAKKLAFIHETAGEIWFKNRSFPVDIAGFILEPWFFRLYHGVRFMTVSHSTKKDLMKFGIPSENINIIHNGIMPIAVREGKSNIPVIMFLGRIAEDKGIADAVEAFFYIRTRMKSARLWIVGKEETKKQKKELISLIERFGMKDSVKIFGYVSEKQKYILLRQAWILLHPSVKEGWGLTVIEAASTGTPTIAYKTGGLSDSIVPNKTGIIVPDRKPDDLARAVITLFTNKDHYEKMCAQAQAWSKKFSWNISISESLKLIEKII